MRATEAAQLFSLLADVLSVGFSLREGLNFAHVMLPKQREQIKRIQAHLKQGNAFAIAIKTFVDLDCYYQIKIAEENGELTQVLTNLGNYLAIKQRQQQKIKAALRYPLAILGCLGILMVAIKQAILPELTSFNHTLVHMPVWGWWSLGTCSILLVLVGAGTLWLGHQPRLRRVVIGSYLPIVGPVLKLYWHYYLSLNLGLLLASGLQSRDVLKLLQTYQPESVLRQLADALHRHLNAGRDLGQFVDGYAFLPPTFKVFFNRGATSLQTAKDLKADAHLTYQRLFTHIENLIGLVQPLLFGVIGLAIVGIYLSILLPMYHAIGGLS
ncbi:ComG operon protein 2 [Furfurilactobacillus siliginis]|uniref:ComG operon protein 2 n=1 Tax=Furfurilactobacillus siliginis TaxID=348151 RepID=A0A0R2L2X3_9LACO|nr:ComG operon protein 2 [Furfurilactobacillus siliginis]